MKTLVVPPLVTALLLAASVGAGQQPPVLTPRDSAFHALNRLAYGPRPGDVDRVAQGGVMTWIEQQLAPERIDDARLAERERRFDLLSYSRDDLARLYLDAQRARRERQQAQRADSMMGPPADQADQSPERLRARRLAGELQELAVVRAARSPSAIWSGASCRSIHRITPSCATRSTSPGRGP